MTVFFRAPYGAFTVKDMTGQYFYSIFLSTLDLCNYY